MSDDQATGVQIDLDTIERDLADVETALARLDAGTYWTDEVTGAPLSDEALAARPTLRRGSDAVVSVTSTGVTSTSVTSTGITATGIAAIDIAGE